MSLVCQVFRLKDRQNLGTGRGSGSVRMTLRSSKPGDGADVRGLCFRVGIAVARVLDREPALQRLVLGRILVVCP
jgi:hypothetical protein